MSLGTKTLQTLLYLSNASKQGLFIIQLLIHLEENGTSQIFEKLYDKPSQTKNSLRTITYLSELFYQTSNAIVLREDSTIIFTTFRKIHDYIRLKQVN